MKGIYTKGTLWKCKRNKISGQCSGAVISRTLPESPRYSRVIPESFPYDPRVIPKYSRVLSSIPEFPELNLSWSTYLLIPE